jgi:hypothetical protein
VRLTNVSGNEASASSSSLAASAPYGVSTGVVEDSSWVFDSLSCASRLTIGIFTLRGMGGTRCWTCCYRG